MTYEVEQKYRLTDPDKLRGSFAELGANRGETMRQSDQYFEHPARDFGQTDEGLRIRSVGDQNFVTYKGPKIDTHTKTRREIELPLESSPQGAGRFAELLQALGFRPYLQVEKVRELWTLSWEGAEIEVAVDDVHGLGTFVELELSADDATLDQARGRLASCAAKLGLTHAERRGYLEMLAAAN